MDTKKVLNDLAIIRNTLAGMTFRVGDVDNFATVKGIVDFIDKAAAGYAAQEQEGGEVTADA